MKSDLMNSGNAMTTFLRRHGLLLLILCLSIPIKGVAAHNMPWDVDIVPVVQRNVQYGLPPVGTLSSVAAYNFPMLSWLHLPMQWLTGHVWWTIFLTMLLFNLLSTVAVYALGLSMFSQRVALVAAVLFTFSEVSISSAYTSWAQLLLPGFFAMTMLALWLWIDKEKGMYLAAAGVLATAAFMTHFSALLLYPAMFVVAIITGAKWQWRWLLVGIILVIALFLPYLQVQIERDFRDMRAFASQDVLVEYDVMQEFRAYQYGRPREQVAQPSQAETVTPQAPNNPSPPQINEVRPRWLRAIDYALEAPNWYWRAMTTAFGVSLRGISEAAPNLAVGATWFLRGQVLLFLGSIALALWQFVRDRSQHATIRAQLVDSGAGRVMLLIIFLTVMIALMIATRTIRNATYWTGFTSIELVIASYIVSVLPSRRAVMIVVAGLLIGYIGIQSSERVLRIVQHDDTQYTPYNVSIYRHVSAVVDYIAEDWAGDESLTVSYDILHDIPNLWWTPAWHSIDPSYRMGMNFDFLLSYHHGLTNTNTDPIGTVEDADYIIIYTPTLQDYDLTQYDIAQFGTIVVLKSINTETSEG